MLMREAMHIEEQGAYGKFCFPLSFVVNLKVKSLSRVRLLATPWTAAYQAPPSMGFSRQEYWSGVPLPSPGDLPNPRIEPRAIGNGLVSPDGMNYTFNLLQNVTFHDGSHMTAADVAYSFSRAMAIHDPDGPSWI